MPTKLQLKKVSTIQRQIRRLRRMAENSAMPKPVRDEAYEAYHALRWAIGDLNITPESLIRAGVRMGVTDAPQP